MINIFLDVSFFARKVPRGAYATLYTVLVATSSLYVGTKYQGSIGNAFHSSQIICTGGALSPNPREWVGAITHPDKEACLF